MDNNYWKEKYADYHSRSESRIAELEQENAELKTKVEELDKMTGIFSARLCEKYRQTLQEIKECLKDWEKAYTSFGFCEYENILEKIKAIITESEVGE